MATDHELRLFRARQQLETLQREIASWLAGYTCTVREDYDPEAEGWPQRSGFYMLGGSVVMSGFDAPGGELKWGRGVITVYIDEAPAEQIPESLALLIDEFLHSIRAALDNLAYALMLAGPVQITETMQRASEFPIFSDPSGFKKDARKITGWTPAAQKVVEALQPYQRGSDYEGDPLWWLHLLDNITKHRYLHTAVANSVGAGWRPDLAENLRAFGPGFLEVGGGRAEPGAMVIRMAGIHLADPEKGVRLGVMPSLDVVFGPETPAVGQKSVQAVAVAIYDHVITKVVPALTSLL